MRLTYNNDFLFTVGKDCCLMIHEVKDKDPRGGTIKRDGGQLPFSDEILTEKQEQEEIISKRDQKYNELAAVRDPSHAGVNDKSSAQDQEEMIKRLQDEQSKRQVDMRAEIENLEGSKNEIEDQFDKQLKLLTEENKQEMEARRNEYS